MTQLDSEIITWLFIAFAGAAFGVLALRRVFSKKELPGTRRSEGASSEASPRRERISSRRENRALPKVEVPPPPQKPEILGPGRPSVFAFCAEGSDAPVAILQRGDRFDDMTSFEGAEVKPEGNALLLLSDRLGALAHEPDDELADRTWMIAVPSETSGKTDALAGNLMLLAFDEKGCPMGGAAPIRDLSAEAFLQELKSLLPKEDAGVASLQKLLKEEAELLQELLDAGKSEESEGALDEKLLQLLALVPAISPGGWRDSSLTLDAVLHDVREAIEESDRALAGEKAESTDDQQTARALILDHLLLMLLLTRTIASGDYLPGMRASAEAVRRAVVWKARKASSSRTEALLSNLRRAEALIDERVLAAGRMPRTLVRAAGDGRIAFGCF
ncbi:hypothetical protein [uncultured Sutterella sp.]|uniref:hypothetical protein n=1 Tax=uncultured Sutterella sp. TaxID=286133 RepID=UPI002624B530|nr:hypothetical protein [uncultured Sutterella sp.]